MSQDTIQLIAVIIYVIGITAFTAIGLRLDASPKHGTNSGLTGLIVFAGIAWPFFLLLFVLSSPTLIGCYLAKRPVREKGNCPCSICVGQRYTNAIKNPRSNA